MRIEGWGTTKWKPIIVIVAVMGSTLGLGGLCSKAEAQQVQCAPAEVAHKWHEEQGQTSQVLGIVNEQTIFELMASPDGTWAIIVTGTDGMTCLAMSGIQLSRLNAE